MNEEQTTRARAASAIATESCGPWTLSRLEIISTVEPKRWPAARVELLHARRGRVLEIATGAGGVDAAFNAVAQIFGVSAPINRLDLSYRSGEIGSLPVVMVSLSVVIDGEIFDGSAQAGDVLPGCVWAYLDALSKAELSGTRGHAPRRQCSSELAQERNK